MSDIREMNQQYLSDLTSALSAMPMGEIEAIGQAIESAYHEGRKIFIVGNGGSAATASHMACDFAKTTLGKSHERITKRFKAIALSDNVPLITAWGNDVSYDRIFGEQMRNLADKGDLLIVITASGNSPNILHCLEVAKELGMLTVGLLGFEGGKAFAMCDDAIVIRSNNYGIIEDAHSILNHMLTAYLKHVVVMDEQRVG